jgi:hypothetical protein
MYCHLVVCCVCVIDETSHLSGVVCCVCVIDETSHLSGEQLKDSLAELSQTRAQIESTYFVNHHGPFVVGHSLSIYHLKYDCVSVKECKEYWYRKYMENILQDFV